MRMLFITPQPPHPTQGGAAIRNWHLIAAAKNAGHTADLLTFGLFQSDDRDAQSVPPSRMSGRPLIRRISDVARTPQPDLANRLGADILRETVCILARQRRYDLIQVEGLEMWPSLLDTALPAIYDAHNAEAT
jgi:hypothetical protein